MTLTKEAIDKYIEQGGVVCPYCGSANLDAGSFQSDSHGAWQSINCENCDKEWFDEYEMVAITIWDDIKKPELPINETDLKTIDVLWLWEQLGDVPVDDEECIDTPWLDFPAGTHREEIWHWFEEFFNISVHALMFPSEHPEIWKGR